MAPTDDVDQILRSTMDWFATASMRGATHQQLVFLLDYFDLLANHKITDLEFFALVKLHQTYHQARGFMQGIFDGKITVKGENANGEYVYVAV